jgi:membrane-bound metal-dependent hydrolase YbcI (DUF457 family)
VGVADIIMLGVIIKDIDIMKKPRISPAGSYVNGAPRICPDGTYVGDGGAISIAPDGTYVAGAPMICPDGSYI